MSILVQPLKYKRLATYLEMDQKNTDLVRPFVKRLIGNRIFDQRFKWFRHDLVQRCFEDDLDPEEKRSYHETAAKFFESLQGQEKEKLGEQQEQAENLNRQNIHNTSIGEEGEEGYRQPFPICLCELKYGFDTMAIHHYHRYYYYYH